MIRSRKFWRGRLVALALLRVRNRVKIRGSGRGLKGIPNPNRQIGR